MPLFGMVRWLGAVLMLVVVASGMCPGVEDSGFGIGPGMMLVENLQPGAQEVDVFGKTDMGFTVHNGTNKPQVFAVASIKPRSAISKWEMGYEEIPDAAWCRMEKNEVELPAHTDGKVRMFVTVPDKPEYYNRKWMALIVCRPGKAGTGAVGLQVGARVQLETLANPDAAGVVPGAAGLVPSVIRLEAKAGENAKGAVKIRNNTDKELQYTVLSLNEAEKDPAKHARYFGGGCVKVIEPSWLKAEDSSFSLKPGKKKELKVKVAVPKNAEQGKTYENLLFLKDGSAGFEFVRVRTAVSAAAKDKD